MKFDGSPLCVRLALRTAALLIAILVQGSILPVKAFAQDMPSLTKEQLANIERERREEYARVFGDCSTQQLTRPDITLAKLFPQLATFAPTQVQVSKYDSGLDGRSGAIYYLDLENDQFRGPRSHYSDPGYGYHESKSDSTVRREVVMEFLRVALRVGVEEKPYEPRICATDSNPSLQIHLQAGTQTLRIWSESQGLTPWGIEFEKRSFVSDTLELGEALRPLAAELRLYEPSPEVQREMEDKRRAFEEFRNGRMRGK